MSELFKKMEQDLESIFDFSNWRKHPSNHNYIVFNFKSEEIAHDFVVALEEKSIEVQYHYENDVKNPRALVAIEKKYFNKARKINFEVLGRHNKGMIPNKIGKYALLIFFLLLMITALVGYIKTNA